MSLILALVRKWVGWYRVLRYGKAFVLHSPLSEPSIPSWYSHSVAVVGGLIIGIALIIAAGQTTGIRSGTADRVKKRPEGQYPGSGSLTGEVNKENESACQREES
jgi:hypothetical protein